MNEYIMNAEESISCLDVSPDGNLAYLGLMDGNVDIYDISGECPSSSKSRIEGTVSCRAVTLINEGKKVVVSRSSSSTVYDSIKCGVIWEEKQKHTDMIYSCAPGSENTFWCGYDDGVIKMWDIRKPKHCRLYKEQTDFISSMIYLEDKSELFAASGDGTLGVYTPGKAVPNTFSEELDEELLSLELVKNNKRLVCGTGEGHLMIFSDGMWGYPTDVYPGHPSSIDSVLKWDEDTIITGSSDGLVRLVQIQPNKLLGVLFKSDIPIDNIVLTSRKHLLVTGFDRTLVCKDLSYLDADSGNSDGSEENKEEVKKLVKDEHDGETSDKETSQKKRKTQHTSAETKIKRKKRGGKSGFFDDL